MPNKKKRTINPISPATLNTSVSPKYSVKDKAVPNMIKITISGIRNNLIPTKAATNKANRINPIPSGKFMLDSLPSVTF